MRKLNLFCILVFTASLSYTQDMERGILESGEFSVHKYFYDLYKDFESSNNLNYIIPSIPLNEKLSALKYKVMGYMPYWFVDR